MTETAIRVRVAHGRRGKDLLHALPWIAPALVLIAGVVSDDMLELTKGRRPVVPLAERMEIVSHISFVDQAHAETVPDKLDTWRSVGFDVFFKGDDWRGTPRGLALEQEFAAVGVEVVYFPYTIDTSSTQLRAAIAALTVPMPDEVAS